MGRTRKPSVSKEGLQRGAWSINEDRILSNYITTHGGGKWGDIPQRAGLKRCGKSCRLRWLNYLRPGIKRGNITHEEEDLIIRLHRLLGNRWSLIAGRLPGRTDNEIKNYWNSYLSKKVHKHRNKSQEEKPTKEPCVEAPKATFESHQVVRAKAGRCNKFFLTQQQEGEMNIEDFEGALMGAPPLAFQDQDFDMEKLLSSDTLDPNSLKGYDEEIRGKGSVIEDDNRENNNVWNFSNHPFLFGEETLENWWMNDSYVQAFIGMELNELTLLPPDNVDEKEEGNFCKHAY